MTEIIIIGNLNDRTYATHFLNIHVILRLVFKPSAFLNRSNGVKSYHRPVDRLVQLVIEQRRPCVDLDQVDLEVLIHHQVVAEELVSVVDRVFRLGPD